MTRRILLAAVTALAVTPATASAATPWTSIGSKVESRSASVSPSAYRGYALDRSALTRQLDRAPREGTRAAAKSAATVAIPAPDGSVQRFLVQDSPIMQAGLQKKYPNIRTFAVEGVDDRTATGRIDLTPLGFHAAIRSDRGTWYVDPRFRTSDRVHVAYFARDLPDREGRMRGESTAPLPRSAPKPKGGKAAPRAEEDIPLRTYRLALLSNPEYATYFGGSDLAVLAAKVTLMNRVNQIYNDDLAVRMLLIDGTDTELNFDTAAEMTEPDGPCGDVACFPSILPNDVEDPNAPGDGLNFGSANAYCYVGTLWANDLTLSRVVGAANFDIGHIALGNDGGGIAQLGAVGNIYKSEGCTGLPTPDGDLYAVDYVAHEMGHQFGGDHTFQGTTNPFDNNNCWGDPDNGGNANRNTDTSVEPGSGSSIMAYAGICRTDDLQPHSDPYFSQRSIDEISTYTTGPVNVGEQQLVTLRSFNGTDSFTLTHNGAESAPIVRGTNYSAAGIKAALDAILPAGADVKILPYFQDFFDPSDVPEPDDLGFVIDFSEGSLATTDVSPITVTSPTGGVTGSVVEEAKGGPGTNGGDEVPSTNDGPEVTAPADATIPVQTPFTLNGTATDAQNDPLTFLWEQNDNGTVNPINLINNAKIDGPLFRVFGTAAEVSDEGTLLFNSPGENVATASGASRTFPDIAQVAADNTNAATGACPAFTVTPDLRSDAIDPELRECYSEFLPTADYASGELNFRLTARDRRTTGGGVGHDDVKLTLAPAAGPFRVTDTQTAAAPGGPLNVTWDVAGTNAAPVGVSAVKISLSTDGGATFPTVLSASTPNDGAETVTLPAGVASSIARVKVEAIGNVFFDMSHTDLTIQPAGGPGPGPTPGPTPTPVTPLEPNLSSVKQQLKVSKTGNVTLRLQCAAAGDGAAAGSCLTVVRLQAQLGGKKRTIAERIATLQGTTARTIHVRLNRRALDRLESKRLKATLRVQVRNAGAPTQTATKRVTIRKRS